MNTHLRNVPIGKLFVLLRTRKIYQLIRLERNTPGGTKYIVIRELFVNNKIKYVETTLHHSCQVMIL